MLFYLESLFLIIVSINIKRQKNILHEILLILKTLSLIHVYYLLEEEKNKQNRKPIYMILQLNKLKWKLPVGLPLHKNKSKSYL